MTDTSDFAAPATAEGSALVKTTLIMITGLEFHLLVIVPDRGQQDRNKLAVKLIRDFPSIHYMPGRWNDPLFDLHRINSPRLMMVGHSFGGDACLALIHSAPDKQVDSLVLLDPVPNDARPNAKALQADKNFKFVIPSNVARCISYRRTRAVDFLTHSKFVVPEVGRVEQRQLDEDHANFYGNAEVEQTIRAELFPLTRPALPPLSPMLVGARRHGPARASAVALGGSGRKRNK